MPKQRKKKNYNAVAISGALIVKDDGRNVTYKKKCDNCGKTLAGATIVVLPGNTRYNNFKCSKCKKRIK